MPWMNFYFLLWDIFLSLLFHNKEKWNFELTNVACKKKLALNIEIIVLKDEASDFMYFSYCQEIQTNNELILLTNIVCVSKAWYTSFLCAPLLTKIH